MVDWQQIDTVLLDMDGTLLDLNFDNQFWQHLVPERYAQANGLSFEQAWEVLLPKFQATMGSLQWYCLDYWADLLQLDIVGLKRELTHLITYRPEAEQFLQALNAHGKQAILITNAHRDSLHLKLEYCDLGQYCQPLVSVHDYGVPKEELECWQHLQQVVSFDPARTLLIDDNHAALRSAQHYGIARLLSIAQPDSQRPPRNLADAEPPEFEMIVSFAQMIP